MSDITALHRSGCAPAAEGHEHTDCEWLKGFAAGRHVEREDVVAYLRTTADDVTATDADPTAKKGAARALLQLADMVVRGEHLLPPRADAKGDA